jgi:hypothetical protein
VEIVVVVVALVEEADVAVITDMSVIILIGPSDKEVSKGGEKRKMGNIWRNQSPRNGVEE